jgi:hypothetical protein
MSTKKMPLLAACLCATQITFAQSDETFAEIMNKTPTAQTFDLARNIDFNIKGIVYLKNGKMIFELMSAEDYASIKPMDSLLKNLRRDIAFYKDSLAMPEGGNVRIDYVISPEYSYSKIRFKKYPQDGQIFLNKNGISRLKMSQDTVNIIIEKIAPGISRKPEGCTINYKIRTSFQLNNYTDLDKLIANKEELMNAIDTVEKTAAEKKPPRHPAYTKKVTVIYNPYYNGKKRLTKYAVLLNNEYAYSPYKYKRNNLIINANIGAGVIMNGIAPMADIGLEYDSHWGKELSNTSFMRLSAAPYFFFTRNEKNESIMNANWFVNATIGSRYNESWSGWPSKLVDVGVGYLVVQKGNFFNGPTFKIFTEIAPSKVITICPELIITNNWSHIYPAVTLKVF